MGNIEHAKKSMRDGNYGAAIEYLTREIEQNPKPSRSILSVAYRNRGVAKGILGEYRSALDDLTEALHIEPNDFVAYYNRGNANKDLGRYEDALHDYTKAKEINEASGEAHYGLGEVKLKMEKYDEALEHFVKALNLARNSENYDLANFVKRRMKAIL